jgi:23S rRNA pseudouridine2605 synthase
MAMRKKPSDSGRSNARKSSSNTKKTGSSSANKSKGSFHPAFKKKNEEKEGEEAPKKKYIPYGRPGYVKKTSAPKPQKRPEDGIRLNKYIANAGICARRDADNLILAGVVMVNDKIVQEMGHKVMPGDIVKCDGATLRLEKLQYLILNKPKDFITSLKDPFHQKTVMHLVKNACKERVFPVGRLDKETTGLLLFTNDGDLAMKLTHPSMEHKKIYHVELDKRVSLNHLKEIKSGIELEDGFVQADDISFVGDDSHQVGIELHVGRNRIVRRIFEHFGYNVKKLDRVVFAGLTKKDLPRGKFRFLTEEEIVLLKRM